MRAMSAGAQALVAAGLVAASALAGFAVAAEAHAAQDGRVIRIAVRRFAFVPDRITVRKGEAVTLEFRTQDVLMGFNAPDLAPRADLPPGQVVRVRLKPAQVGTFPFLCDVFCGSGHENMNGVIEVVE